MNTLFAPLPIHNQSRMTQKPSSRAPRRRVLTGTLLSVAVLLSGCNQQSANPPEDPTAQTPEQIRAASEAPAVMSDSAKARIKQFEPIFVTQMQSLQRRLQAEFESLQAADMPDSDNPSLLTGSEALDTTSKDTTASKDEATSKNTAANINETAANDEANPNTNIDNTDNDNDNTSTNAEEDINISTEVGKRDLEVLKRISLEPRAPEILDEDSIIERYQNAMQALYEPAVTPLTAQNIDTLLTIATLIPHIFEHDEIARQLSIKSPALARLIAQHQVWEQIEAQQAVNMQQMKLEQQAEFEALMTKFNDTIKDYDEQIAKYEQTLKTFEQ